MQSDSIVGSVPVGWIDFPDVIHHYIVTESWKSLVVFDQCFDKSKVATCKLPETLLPISASETKTLVFNLYISLNCAKVLYAIHFKLNSVVIFRHNSSIDTAVTIYKNNKSRKFNDQLTKYSDCTL